MSWLVLHVFHGWVLRSRFLAVADTQSPFKNQLECFPDTEPFVIASAAAAAIWGRSRATREGPPWRCPKRRGRIGDRGPVQLPLREGQDGLAVQAAQAQGLQDLQVPQVRQLPLQCVQMTSANTPEAQEFREWWRSVYCSTALLLEKELRRVRRFGCLQKHCRSA
jgi:hypothetical protein